MIPTQQQQQMVPLPEGGKSSDDQKVLSFLDRRKDISPKVNSKTIEEEGGDVIVLLARYAEAMGSISDDFRTLIFQQVGAFEGQVERTTLLNSCLALLNSLKPRNELESLLLVEIFMLHNAFAEMTRRLVLTDDPKHSESLVNRMDKLARSLRESLASLQKLRGQGSQQKVIVEHVHVNQGGQAIVGSVSTTRQTGEGGVREKQTKTP